MPLAHTPWLIVRGAAHSQESLRSSRHSFANEAEALLVVHCINRVCLRHPDVAFSGRIGVITPYKEQVVRCGAVRLANPCAGHG